jgi:hypothetical protein
MKSYDSLQINFTPSIETYDSITEIIGVMPTDKDFEDKISNTWTYEVIEEQNDPFYDFINKFLDLLEYKYDKLAEIGIKRSDISIWYLYEYDQQCNMEFDPTRLKRLGENGITLCVSCWDSGQEYKIE